MKAVCIYSYGGPEVLRYEDVPRPHPGRGEVLVRVHAAGVNPVDWKVRDGHLKEMLHHHFPLILGWDVAGTISAIGSEVERLKGGDEIFCKPDITRDGAYAEYLVVKESEVALKPKSIDFVQAASLPLTGLTARQSLIEAAQISSGQRVLIHGAAGGVGVCALQLAKWKGAYAIGTASAHNHDFLRTLGADEALDYATNQIEDTLKPVDIVFDTIGGDTQQRSWKLLKPGGILVSIAQPPSKKTADAHKVREAFVFTQPSASQLTELANLVESGKLTPIIGTVLPLSDARKAHELSQTGHTRGKIVLRVV